MSARCACGPCVHAYSCRCSFPFHAQLSSCVWFASGVRADARLRRRAQEGARGGRGRRCERRRRRRAERFVIKRIDIRGVAARSDRDHVHFVAPPRSSRARPLRTHTPLPCLLRPIARVLICSFGALHVRLCDGRALAADARARSCTRTSCTIASPARAASLPCAAEMYIYSQYLLLLDAADYARNSTAAACYAQL